MVVTRRNGARSREAVLATAAALTATGGRESASTAAIAARLGMSKAGVFALFGSKDGLDQAMVDWASDRFRLAVIGPAGAAPAGLARLSALCEGFLVFAVRPGTLTAAHRAFGVGMGPRASARLAAWAAAWHRALEGAAAEAVAQGECRRAADPGQIAFELGALLDGIAARVEHPPTSNVLARTRSAVDRSLLAWSGG